MRKGETAADYAQPPPRSDYHAGKEIKEERNVLLNGTSYLRRIFTDDSAELVRFDTDSGKWVVLCFQAA